MFGKGVQLCVGMISYSNQIQIPIPMAMGEEIHLASTDIEDMRTQEEEGEEKAENKTCHVLS